MAKQNTDVANAMSESSTEELIHVIDDTILNYPDDHEEEDFFGITSKFQIAKLKKKSTLKSFTDKQKVFENS